MDVSIPALILLAVIWFPVYWVLGGVLFALVAIARFQRLKRVQFSCGFSLIALLTAAGSAYAGLALGKRSIGSCLADAENHAQAVGAVFGCGFFAVIGAFLVGAGVLVVLGFVLMALSQGKDDPWIRFDMHGDEGLEEGLPNVDASGETGYHPPHSDLSHRRTDD